MIRPGGPRPLDVLWQPPTLVSIFVANELLALILTLNPASSEAHPVAFGLFSFAIQWVTLFTLGGLYALRGRLRKVPPHHAAMVGLALLIAISLLSTWVSAWLLSPTSPDGDGDWLEAGLRFTATLVAMAIFGLLALRAHWSAQQSTLQAKQAELEALQARIRPHFLFNTLNTGAALVHSRPEEAERLLLDLADLFRAALAGPRDISLEDELSLVRRYLEIESLRFGERLRVEWDVPAAIPDAQVPSLSIQPLVENAIRHGVERVPHGGRVEIALTTTAEHVVVRIRNPLVFSDAQPPTSHGVGLNASQARIEALTSGRGSVQTGRQGEHWVATVRLPRRPASSDRRRRV